MEEFIVSCIGSCKYYGVGVCILIMACTSASSEPDKLAEEQDHHDKDTVQDGGKEAKHQGAAWTAKNSSDSHSSTRAHTDCVSAFWAVLTTDIQRL